MNGQLRIVGVVVVALLLAGGGFAAGMTLGPGLKGQAAASSGAATNANGNGRFVVRPGASGAPGQGGQLEQVSGRVISVNEGSVTIETQRPGASATTSAIALVGASTRLVKTTETQISLSDLKPGDQVLVLGTPDTAGTVSANAVVVGANALQQLFGGFGGRGGGTGRPSPSPSARP